MAKEDRYTWTGAIFGSSVKHHIDYLFADSVTSSRATASFYTRGIGYPSDHFILGTKYDIAASPKLKISRPAYKPIGWKPTDLARYDMEVARYFAEAGPRRISDISAVVKTIASAWTAPRPPSRRRGQAMSATERVFRAPLRHPDLSPVQRHEAATKI